MNNILNFMIHAIIMLSMNAFANEDSNIYVKSNEAYFHGHKFQVSIGKNGITHNHVEGDLSTPSGSYIIKKLYYRADKIGEIETKIDKSIIQPNDIWCDDPENSNYNRHMKFNSKTNFSHEKLYRKDNAYDLLLETSYNDSPSIPYKGSAVFIHVKISPYTAGCVAFDKKDLIYIIKNLKKDSKIIIEKENHD